MNMQRLLPWLLLAAAAIFLVLGLSGRDGGRPVSVVMTLTATHAPPMLPTATSLPTNAFVPVTPTATPLPTTTPSPQLPTATTTPISTATPKPTATPLPSVTPSVTPTPATTVLMTPTVTATSTVTATPPATATAVLPVNDLARFGIAGFPSLAVSAAEAGLQYGTLLGWETAVGDPMPAGVTAWHMIRVNAAGVRVDWDQLATEIAADPGAVWVIGNEMDVHVQDNVPAAQYATQYHAAYTFIKEQDPTALVAIGGVAQSTSLRRQYLDDVLATYQTEYGTAMPVDIWTVHAYTLPEVRDSWGVDIPPGMSADVGLQVGIEDHDRLDLWTQNLRDFRDWMAARGYADRPLAVTEFGILLPPDMGFEPPRVRAFMHAALDFLMTATGPNGYAPDDNRLVQWWFWYTLRDEHGWYNGYLLTENGQLSPIGVAWNDYLNAR